MELAEKIKSIIAKEVELSVEQVKDEMTVEDLGVDSLAMSSVLATMEDEGFDIDTEQIFDTEEEYTVGNLIEKIVSSIK